MMFDMLVVIFLIGCLVYGIKETMEPVPKKRGGLICDMPLILDGCAI